MATEMKILREQARERSIFYEDTSNAIQLQVDGLHKWILASCLTVNAGAIIFTFSIQDMPFDGRKYSSILFVVGVISAILYAMLYNLILSQTQMAISLVAHQFRDFANGGDEEPNYLWQKPLDRLRKLGRMVDWFHYVSLICFIFGSAIVGYYLS